MVSGLLGLFTAYAFGSEYPEVTSGSAFSTLVLRVALLSGAMLALRYWRAGARLVPPRAVAPVGGCPFLAAVTLFLSFNDFSKPYEYMLLLALMLVVAVASVVLPLVGALLVPRRVGAAMMGAWAVTQGTLLVRRPVLCLPYLGILAVAVVLWRRAGRGLTVPPGGRRLER